MNQSIIVGYTTGVFDLFHYGHLNIIKQAKSNCDYLVVGVSTDELVYQMKGKFPEIPYSQRCEIISSISYVDKVVPEVSEDKYEAWKNMHYDILFKGSDARERPIYKKLEEKLNSVGVKIVYFPYTEGVSSSSIKKQISSKNIVNKNYCMSSYLTVRYVSKDDFEFKEGLRHRVHPLIPREKKYPCKDARDVDYYIRKVLDSVELDNTALFLSGGIDSAILASYLPRGSNVYTVRAQIGTPADESEQAKIYADINNLKQTVIDVTWDDYKGCIDRLMLRDGSPIIPNEPQCYMMARRAVEDGNRIVLYGDAADTEFGGMDLLLAKDWSYNEWIERFTFVKPMDVLRNPTDVSDIFEPYRVGDRFDFIKFIKEVYAKSASGAASNACELVGLQYLDPYELLCMKDPLDLGRVRNGESKYIIRDLFRMKYPELDVPEKKTMFRPSDEWLKDWNGPKRNEFLPECVNNLNGEQRLLVYCLERFLDLIDA